MLQEVTGPPHCCIPGWEQAPPNVSGLLEDSFLSPPCPLSLPQPGPAHLCLLEPEAVLQQLEWEVQF